MFAFSAFPADAAAWLALLLHVSAKATLVLVTAAVVCLALRRASAALRHLVWTLAIVCVLCLPLLSMVLPAWRVGGLTYHMPASTSPHPVADSAVQPTTDEAMVTTSTGGLTEAEAGQPTLPSDSRSRERSETPSMPTAGPSLSQRIPSLVLSLWALGALAAFAHVLVSMLCVRRAVRGARRLADPAWQRLVCDASAQLRLRRPVALLSSRFETVPMVWGWRHAILLLPADGEGWSPQRRWLVILHELAHVKRADCLTQMLGYLARAVYWFNPLAWLATRQLRREREQACDDLVLNSGLRSSDYAAHLLAIAGRLQRPTLAQTAAVAMAHRAGLEGRIRAILDARRPRRAVPRLWALMVALAAAVLLVAVASVQGADAQLADETTLHGLGAREQWQPQTESDPRLQQPVHFEVLGRAAVPALAMLSEQTGVSLTVAPENLDTVGERKLTIIAQGCTLKSLMAQIPKALQECHWDIDASGPEPVYLLHRNAGAELTVVRLAEEVPLQERLRREVEGRAAREARVQAARKALAMSPEELAELEKTDLYLARSVQEPRSRSMLELFLSLPEDQMKQFIDTAKAAMLYPEAPEHFRKAADQLLQASREEWTAKEGASSLALRILDVVQGDISHATIQYEDDSEGGSHLRIFAFDDEGSRNSWGVEPALWSQYPRFLPDRWYRPLLLGSGTPDEKTADALAQEWERKGEAERQRRKEEKRKAEWREPQSPALHRTVTLPFSAEERVDPVQVQQFVAKETGLSLVSDYFTPWFFPPSVPEDARVSMPVWRLLHVLGEHWFWTYEWDEVGDCLVFHDRYWYRKPPEAPEALVQVCREKLKQQGYFTLDDVAAAAVALAARPSPRASHPVWGVAWPYDIARRGMNVSARPPLLLYASLSPKQRAKARSETGLPYAEMTRAQEDLVRSAAVESEERWRHPDRPRPPLPEHEIANAVYRIKESRQDLPGQPGDLLDAGPAMVFELQIEFPSRQVRNTQCLPLPEPPA